MIRSLFEKRMVRVMIVDIIIIAIATIIASILKINNAIFAVRLTRLANIILVSCVLYVFYSFHNKKEEWCTRNDSCDDDKQEESLAIRTGDNNDNIKALLLNILKQAGFIVVVIYTLIALLQNVILYNVIGVKELVIYSLVVIAVFDYEKSFIERSNQKIIFTLGAIFINSVVLYLVIIHISPVFYYRIAFLEMLSVPICSRCIVYRK